MGNTALRAAAAALGQPAPGGHAYFFFLDSVG